jgi:ABC-type transport system involved in multi-copper enzyme maturation permease subunit
VTEMVRRFLRQKFTNVGVVIALSALALLAAFQLALSRGQGGFEVGYLAVLVLAAACVSRDAGSGALQMILCRPIRRSSYVLGRYVGILVGYGVFLVAASGIALLFSRALPMMSGLPLQPLLGEMARGAAGAFLSAAGMAAPILLLSVFLPGYGDVLGYILLTPLLTLPGLAAQIFNVPAFEKAGKLLRENLLPSPDWSSVFAGTHSLAEPVGRWLFALVAYVVLAIALFSRREFAYGQD